MSYSPRHSSSYSNRYEDASSRDGNSFILSMGGSSRCSSEKDYCRRIYDYTTQSRARESNENSNYGARSSKYRSYYSDYLDDNSSLSNTKEKKLEGDEVTNKSSEDSKETKKECSNDEEIGKEKCEDYVEKTKNKYRKDEDKIERSYSANEEEIKMQFVYEGIKKKDEGDEKRMANQNEEEEETSKKKEMEDVPELDNSASANTVECDEEPIRSFGRSVSANEESEEALALGIEDAEVEYVKGKNFLLKNPQVECDINNMRRYSPNAQSERLFEAQQVQKAAKEEHEEILHWKEDEEATNVLLKANLLNGKPEKGRTFLIQSSKFSHKEKQNFEAQTTSAPRANKIIIEQNLLKNKVADLIAKFDKCSAMEELLSWENKTDLRSKPVGKIHSTFFK